MCNNYRNFFFEKERENGEERKIEEIILIEANDRYSDKSDDICQIFLHVSIGVSSFSKSVRSINFRYLEFTHSFLFRVDRSLGTFPYYLIQQHTTLHGTAEIAIACWRFCDGWTRVFPENDK